MDDETVAAAVGGETEAIPGDTEIAELAWSGENYPTRPQNA
jgi:hypothetical protein